ncbi:GIY-YIG nuclease family protein [Haloarcula nitratireducens]|uniref:GIY-YIG nuclease family protein n=1 Tax=Haloarcula nitratireducens TaxID=2487749 RepID=A0AAW4PGC1_9EURY|nr:GIY-YIG nuclease family protein [Halomicroarcula nitratireducens]MBX0296658.1 GIY-YIG nuclease family protein [Halomicroarcula nitratireducens]
MPDFREEINRLQDEYKKDQLIGILAEKLGERTTSVNPLTTAMFTELRPGTRPVEYARKSEGYSEDTSRVATRAIALKRLLHEQVGRPLYAPVETLKKQDFAECITAIDAFHEGVDYGMGAHTPTTLPLNMTAFVDNPPSRSATPHSPFEIITDLESTSGIQQVETQFATADSPYFVYVLDCTPSIEDEPPKIWDRRRAVQTKIKAGAPLSEFEPKEQATNALNQSKRVYYVGSTNDIGKRVREHLSGTDESGVNFTNTLSPQSLVKVRSCGSRPQAASMEGALARELTEMEGLFAYSDEM